MGASLPVVFIMGATASGKTSVAMELVERLSADIVSVDSAMIYTDMNIGTAKPDSEELAKAPHALIDILDPKDSWSVGEFCQAARAEIKRCHDSGRIPLLTGGTMMYFRALEYGLNDLPAADEAVRRQINAMADEHGWPIVHAELERVDKRASDKIHPNDSQRIQRALEVFRLTGTPMSQLQAEQAMQLEYPLIKCVLNTTSRPVLHDRIHQRLDDMMKRGFLDEVKALHERGDLHADMPSMRSVGYRQLWAYLEGEMTLDLAIEKAKTATRQLAKRQMTWIRSLNDTVPFEAGAPDTARKLEQLIGG